MQASSIGCSRAGVRQAVEKRLICGGALHRAYQKYTSFLTIACMQVSETARALHLCIFEQPEQREFFNALLDEYYLSGF